MSLEYLLLINVSIVFSYLFFTKTHRAKIKVDHLLLIIAGFVFYWLLPIYAYEHNLFINHHRELYESISYSDKKIYIYYVLIIILSFLLGDWISNKFTSTFSFQNFYCSRKVLDTFYWILLALGFYSVFFMRNVFFTGYDAAGLWPHERGWFISVCSCLITLNVVNSLTQIVYNPENISKNRIIFLLIFNKYFFSAFLFNFLMLTTGNRGYFVVFILSMLLIYNEINNGIYLKNLIILFFLFVVFNSSIALIRSRDIFATLSFDRHLGNFFYESVNVGITLLYHIQNMDYNLVEFPDVLISKFIGIIPSAIFPGKFALMISPADVGKSVIRYQATTHNYVEFMINFGLIGTIFIFFFIGIGLNWLKSKKHYVPIYIAVSAQIPFFFFRSFYDAIVKYIFEFSILLPLLILFISYVYRKHMK